MNYVKLKKPEKANAINQGEQPKHLRIKINGDLYLLPFGGVFGISAKCDSKNNVADLSKKPYPLIHPEFVEENKSMFTKIKKEK